MLRRLGGAAPARDLLARGASARTLTAAVRRGDVIRPRHGWYALPSLDVATITAVRAGGVVSCVTLLDALGVWVPPRSGPPHIAVPRNAAGRHSTRGMVVHWSGEAAALRSMRDSVPGALRNVARCCGVELAVASADSALRAGVLSDRDLASLPAAIRRRVDSRGESGGESVVRQRLRALGIRFAMQVRIDRVGRVDFVVGDRLVIEVDGYAYHGTREAFERDRGRDLALVEQGRLVIRVSQRQVLDEWPRIERAILAIVRSRRHRWPRVRSEGGSGAPGA